ncbi:MAG: PAS domain S-box protein [Spirulina sp.]
MFHRIIDYNPSIILPEMSVREALEVFKDREKECLLVGRSRDCLVGLLTPAQLLQHIATVKDWENDPVEAIAIRQFTICLESELGNLKKLCKLVRSSPISHLLIADERNQIIGILLKKNFACILDIVREVEEAFIKRLDAEIEKQQLLQQKLHTSYTQTNALLGAMSDIVFAIDLETDNLKVQLPNPNLTHEASADFLNQTIEQFYHGSNSEFFVRHVKQALKEQKTIELEYTLLDNSDTAWFAARISPISETSAIWVARNISDRKRAETALQYLAAELEKRVLERTLELHQLNRDLEDKVRERTIQLQASGTRFRSLFEQAAVGVAQVSLDNEWLLVNQKLCEILGYPREELIHKQCWEITHPEDLPATRARLQGLLAGETPTVSLEKRYLCKDGSTVWTNITQSLVRDREGQPKYGVKIVEDISDRKQAEAELAKLSLVASKTDNLVIISDRDGAIEWVNESFTKTTQYTLEEVRGRKPGQFLQGALTDPKTIEQMRQVVCDRTSFVGEVLNYRKDGTPYWLALSINPVCNDRGELTNFIAIESDITQRKESELALQVSEKRLQLALEASGDGLWDWNIATGEVYFNHLWCEMLGYRQEELSGRIETWQTLIHPEDLSQFRESLDAHFQESSHSFALDYRLRMGSGEWKWVAGYGKVVDRDETGKPLRAIGTHRDISDRKQAEQEVLKALTKEKELNQLKSGFITIASHEFRTPLTVIIAAAKLLEHYDDKLSREQKKQQLERLLRASDRLLRLLEDILILGKADAGKIECNPAPMDLKVFCEELLAELRLSDDDRHELIFSDRGSTDHKVSLDENLLHHILSNLLSNALKYSPVNGEVELELQIRDRHAIFKVSDRGIGIPPEDMPHLFEAFHRAKNSRNIQGTGLGLAIVKRAVNLHSGTISVESRAGGGTMFAVTIPFSSTSREIF